MCIKVEDSFPCWVDEEYTFSCSLLQSWPMSDFVVVTQTLDSKSCTAILNLESLKWTGIKDKTNLETRVLFRYSILIFIYLSTVQCFLHAHEYSVNNYTKVILMGQTNVESVETKVFEVSKTMKEIKIFTDTWLPVQK